MQVGGEEGGKCPKQVPAIRRQYPMRCKILFPINRASGRGPLCDASRQAAAHAPQTAAHAPQTAAAHSHNTRPVAHAEGAYVKLVYVAAECSLLEVPKPARGAVALVLMTVLGEAIAVQLPSSWCIVPGTLQLGSTLAPSWLVRRKAGEGPVEMPLSCTLTPIVPGRL